MAPEKSDDFLVRERLGTLGVSQLVEWDVLVFLYRHGTSLTSAAQIAHLLGADKMAVSGALDRLESLDLLQRSRGFQGIRLFRFLAPADPSRHSSVKELMSLAAKRPGRLQLLKHLDRGGSPPPVHHRGLRLA